MIEDASKVITPAEQASQKQVMRIGFIFFQKDCILEIRLLGDLVIGQ